MFTYHYLHPEGLWGVFAPDKTCCAMFATAQEAQTYCARHNNKLLDKLKGE